MSLLTVCQQVARETGQTVPSSIVGSGDTLANTLLAIAQTSGRAIASGRIYRRGELLKQHDWSDLRKEQTFSTSNGTATYALTGSGSIVTDADFDRFVSETWWDRSNATQMVLFTPSEWQAIKSGLLNTIGMYKGIIKRGRFLVIDPTPTSTETLVFEYISNKWCQSSGGTAQSSWAADTDTGIIGEDLLALDMKWRLLARFGEAYAEERQEAEDAIMVAAANDGGRRMATFRSNANDLLLLNNIPETGFGA